MSIYASALVLRNALPQLLPSLYSLSERNELSTPITSYSKLLEGQFLAKLNINPYAGGSFHHPPLLLFLSLDFAKREWLSTLIWSLAELGTAFCLSKIIKSRKGRVLLPGEVSWQENTIICLFLFHPFSILTSLARSTIVFSNFFVALSIACALDGSILLTAFALSFATHLSLYPILLTPPIALLLCHDSSSKRSATETKPKVEDSINFMDLAAWNVAFKFIGAVSIHQSMLLGGSRLVLGNWDFIFNVYGVILTIPDLTPTIGLGWYFFIEMFDYFRRFFIGVFQLHVLIYVAPLTIAYRKDPLFAIVILVGIISVFKSYPSLGDFALWHSLLVCYSELHLHLSSPVLLICFMLYSLCLLPTFHHLWLYSGSGNANFFYASTLVWAISQGGLLIDFAGARGRREVLLAMEEAGRKKVREGKWKVLQK